MQARQLKSSKRVAMLRILWVILKYLTYLTFIVGFVIFFAVLITFAVKHF